MPRRALLALSTLIIALAQGPSLAHACSCSPRTPAQYLAGADRVYLARAGTEVTRGGRTKQVFKVLHTLKGAPAPSWTRLRNAVRAPCHASYRAGEVSLIFVTKGALELCSGNFPLSGQLDRMAEYLSPQVTKNVAKNGKSAHKSGASKKKRGKKSRSRSAGKSKGAVSAAEPAPAPPLGAFQAGLAASLRGYLHDRPRVPVVYTALTGKLLRVGKTSLMMMKPGGRLDDRAVKIQAAVSNGPVHFIAGFYPTEGFAFKVLLLQDKASKFTVLGLSGAER